MKNLTALICLLIAHCSLYAFQDIEEDILEILRDLRLKKSAQAADKQKKSNEQPAQESVQQLKPIKRSESLPTVPFVKVQKKVDYKELYENFELYEKGEVKEEYTLDKEALLKEASDEIALFDEYENAEFDLVARVGAVATCCFITMCIPFIPVEAISELNETIKHTISSVGGLGFITFSAITGIKAHEYWQRDQTFKERHVAIKEWLNRVH